MATNPMQRKARNSFLLGMVVMLLISGVVIALLFMQLLGAKKKEDEAKNASAQAYALNQDVSSGQVITTDMLTKITVNKTTVPGNAVSDLSIIENYALQDKEGNEVTTKYSKDGKEAKLYIKKKVGNDREKEEYELKQEDDTDNYYIEKDNNKEYIELNSVPLVAKVNMKAKTLLTPELVSKSDNKVADDVRRQEYNIFTLPMDLATGDYVDARLMLPTGEDYIVVAKKEVEIPNISGTDSEDTIWINLREDEILSLSSAIVDAFYTKGAKLYLTKYTEAGMQQAATPTYVVNSQTAALLNKDPNLLSKAKEGLLQRYREIGSGDVRSNIDSAVHNSAGDEGETNLQTKMDESIKNTQENRKKYLDSLSGAVQ